MEIKDIKRLTLGHNDTLVIKYDADLVSDVDMEDSRKCLKEMFPEHKTLFVPKEMDVEVVEAKDA